MNRQLAEQLYPRTMLVVDKLLYIGQVKSFEIKRHFLFLHKKADVTEQRENEKVSNFINKVSEPVWSLCELLLSLDGYEYSQVVEANSQVYTYKIGDKGYAYLTHLGTVLPPVTSTNEEDSLLCRVMGIEVPSARQAISVDKNRKDLAITLSAEGKLIRPRGEK